MSASNSSSGSSIELKIRSSVSMSNSPVKAQMKATDSVCKTSERMINFSHTWVIKNFTFFLDEKFIHSPPFAAENDPGTKWYLEIYPRGDGEENKDYISLHLCLESSEAESIQVKFSLALMNGCARLFKELKVQGVRKFTSGKGWGWSKFILRDSLLKNEEADLPGDKLVVRCKISYALETENIPSRKSHVETRCDVTGVLSELYENRALSDVVFSLDGKDFRAHRSILAARSPILKALFELDHKAGKTSRIDVANMTEQTLEDLLRFIYTGEADVPDNMNNLLHTIDTHVSRRS